MTEKAAQPAQCAARCSRWICRDKCAGRFFAGTNIATERRAPWDRPRDLGDLLTHIYSKHMPGDFYDDF